MSTANVDAKEDIVVSVKPISYVVNFQNQNNSDENALIIFRLL